METQQTNCERLTLETAWADYAMQLRADGRSDHTIAQYSRHVRLFGRWLADTEHGDALDRVDHRVVARFMASDEARLRADGQPKKPTSANALRTSLRVFFAYLHDAGYLDRNPAKLMRLARCGPPPPRAISDRDLQRMFDAMERDGSPLAMRDRAMFGLAACTGLRVGSLAAIRVEDINFETREIAIARSKGNSPYTVRFDTGETERVKHACGEREIGPLFLTAFGASLSTRQVQRRFQTWASRVGMSQGSVHGLRHRLACIVYDTTRDVCNVQHKLGHRSFGSTWTYIRGLLGSRSVESNLHPLDDQRHVDVNGEVY